MKTLRCGAWTAVCVCGLATLLAATGCGRRGGMGGGAVPKTEDEKTLYALGLMLGRNVEVFELKGKDIDLVEAGMMDAVNKKKPLVDIEQYGPKVQALAQTRAQARATKEKADSKAIVEKASKESGAVKTTSGMVIRTTSEGSGAKPEPTDRVKVHYEGRLTDGTVFDSSKKRNEPATFPLNGVIKCWTEGVGMMKVGGKAVLTCPSDLAYGDNGRPPTIPGGATLIFDVELLEIVKDVPGAAPGMSPPQGPPPGH